MKLLKFIVGLVLCTSVILADTASGTGTAAGSTTPISLLSTGSKVNFIQIANSSAANILVKLFDIPSTSLTWTNAAWTNRVATTGYTTNVYTDIAGNSYTNVYPSVSYSASTVTASTNNYPVVMTIAIPANTTYSLSPVNPINLNFGLGATNSAGTNVTYTIGYSPAQ